MVRRHKSRSAPPEHVCQCLIVLPRTEPLVWRRIQIPEAYSFWDLHVAIQDAMGWKDYHLHEFTVVDARTGRAKRIGIPDDEMPDERPCLYPRCIAGAGACPPEDVGGTSGYTEFLRTIGDNRHPERAAMLEWAGGSFDPRLFDPKAVVFDDPAERWKRAFEADEAE